MEHLLNGELLNRRIRVQLVGVGGSGAQIAGCLARLDVAMRAFGHPCGLHVQAFDNGRVREANIGRQIYSRADIGQNKAVLTIHRLNLFHGLDWDALPCRIEEHWEAHLGNKSPDILISCVDTATARRHIHEHLFDGRGRTRYWLDLGNREADGQVCLGEPLHGDRPESENGLRLPCVTELYPELLVPEKEIPAPSCSARLSLSAQGLFVNDLAARYASQLLYQLFTAGRLHHHAVLFNLASQRSVPIDVDPAAWHRFGIDRAMPAPLASS